LLKERNLSGLHGRPGFTFLEADLRSTHLENVVQGADHVVHLAAMAGLVRSWQELDGYMTCNVLATQRLLEAIRVAAPAAHLVHASTSSVYGRFATGDEGAPLAPISPYGITKLAAENLVRAYGEQFALRATVLRLFSVYGPRQRPDMGYNIFIRRILAGETITIDGDGTDSRSNTFVADCVEGIVQALRQPEVATGETFNIGGGQEVTVNEVLSMLEELTGLPVRTQFGPARAGDQRRTAADTTKARQWFGYNPHTSVVDGLRAQLAWQRDLLAAS
ncbi:MAG: NAD-dependent epimerase/dehydratase family protein, partial [Caldilineaceae bacterium]